MKPRYPTGIGSFKEVCFIGIAFCRKQFKMQAREHVPFKAELLQCGSLEKLATDKRDAANTGILCYNTDTRQPNKDC